MNLILILAISVSVSAGIYLLLSRELFRIVMGLAILGAAANLVVFLGSWPGTLVPAVIEQGSVMLPHDAASPLPQALVLTAIVIGFALLCFLLILAAVVSSQQHSSDVANYRENEPTTADAQDADKPSVMESSS